MPIGSDEDIDLDLLERHFGEREPEIKLSDVANELICLRCDWRVEDHKCSFVCPFCGSSNFGRKSAPALKVPGGLTVHFSEEQLLWKDLAHRASDRYRKTSHGVKVEVE